MHPAVARDFLIPVVMVMMVVIIAVVMMVMVPIPPPPALVMMMVLSNPRLAVRARVGSFRILVLEQSERAWDGLKQVSVRCGRF